MKKALLAGLVLCAAFIIPSITQAGGTINSVSINGSTSGITQVDPGDNITVSVTATLTDGEKWKGTNWGINNFGITPTCVNSKNSKEGTQNNSTGVYTETFKIKAPASPGLYNVNFLLDNKNNCGSPVGGTFTSLSRIRVGNDTAPPVIAPHSDILVVSATPTAVTYTNPTAIDDMDSVVVVTCSPASGSTFPIGDTIVTCSATDSAGNPAVPATFKITVQVPTPTDTVAPVIAPHANVSVPGGPGGVAVNYVLPTATDNVDASVTVNCVPALGFVFPQGTTTVTCNAEDAAGNDATPTTFDVGVYVGAGGLIYEYWPTEVGGPGLTSSSVNGNVYNPLISVKFLADTEVDSVCLAIDSYESIDSTVKLGIYAMPTPTSVGSLLAQSNAFPFAGQYVDWFFSGQVTCFEFPTPYTLLANTQYAFGVDRTLNSTTNEDIFWFSVDNVGDPNVWTSSATTFPGGTVVNDDKPYIRIYGVQ